MTKHNYNKIFNINENFMIIKYENRINETLLNIIRN